MMSGHRALVQNISGTYDLFAAIDEHSVALLVIAIHAAFIGGIISILARFQDFCQTPRSAPFSFISQSSGSLSWRPPSWSWYSRS